ncbi:MAG TPA: shikimate dehydrogenase [Acidimicrobiales bacterium]|nr:shikimate dehydrogenase [Acidimicrobiales bacterium]
MISGATRVAGVIGDPVAHSLSPALHNAAFQALGLDWVYAAFPVPAGAANAVAAVAGMRALGIAGLNVTMPHQAEVIRGLDRLSPTAQRLHAVNTIHWEGDDLVGDNTDGAGFLDALRYDEGFDVADRTAVVFGAGGAARAVVLALAGAGAAEIVVVNRTAATGAQCVALAGDAGRLGDERDVPSADVVVNATPIGMIGANEDDLLLDPSLLHAGQVVVDLVYHPLRTPLLRAAKEQGAAGVSGLGMLIHQAAHAFRLWTGEDPPLEAMSAAAMGQIAPG